MALDLLGFYRCPMIPAEHPDRSATLLWFPIGEMPAYEDFSPRDEDPRAEKFWFLHEALIDAIRDYSAQARRKGYSPWIRYKGIVLDEDDILNEDRRLVNS